MSMSKLARSENARVAQSALFKLAAIGCIIANYGRYELGKQIRINIKLTTAEKEHSKRDNWLGYHPNAFTALYGFYQGFWYYFAMGLFYYHMSTRRGPLSRLEIAGLVNQMVFHSTSIYDFRGLSQKVSAAFLAAIGAGTAFQYLGNQY